VQHATFPGVNATLTTPHAPWILYGGSLAGAQTAFSLHTYGGDGGLLWAGIGASATTKAKLAYPEWRVFASESVLLWVLLTMS